MSSPIHPPILPQTYLLNNISPSIFLNPVLTDITLDKLSIEYALDGTQSVISLVDNDLNYVNPYLDLSNFDTESKSWLWFYRGLPYRLLSSGSEVILKGIYAPITLGPYVYDYNHFINDLKITPTFPITLTIAGRVLEDITNYFDASLPTSLIPSNGTTWQYYYDFNHKIYTGQLLDTYDLSQIHLTYYNSNVDINVIVLAANNSSDRSITPVINSYSLKLVGQDIQ